MSADPFVTVDAAHSRDLDDAISVTKAGEGWLVRVAVSDVSAAIPCGDEVDLAAYRQGQTRYVGDGVSRAMLPRTLSEDVVSLAEGRPRRVLVFETALDARLDVTGFGISRATVCVRRRLDHAGALKAASSGDEVGLMLKDAIRLSEGLFAKRVRSGALAAFDTATGLMTDEEGRMVDAGNAAPAYRLVQELMILTNAAAARDAAEKGLQLLFRNQRGRPAASRRSLGEDAGYVSRGFLNRKAYAEKLTMLLARADLGCHAEGHWSLNVPAYAWFTSPIRRFADLVNHRMILAAHEGEAAPYSSEELGSMADHLNGLVRSDREGFSDLAKSHAANRAKEALTRDGGDALSTSQMSQVIRKASTGGGFDPVSLAEARRRSLEASLTAKDIFRLLTMTGEGADGARDLAADHLFRRPEDAPSLLNHATNVAAWTAREEIVSGVKPFAVKVHLDTGDGVFTGRAVADNKKTALQRALAAATLSSAGMQSPIAWWPDNALPTPRDPVPSGNHKGALLEHCARHKRPTPNFVTTESGPSHAPTFTCTISMKSAGISKTAISGTKKGAEAAAALKILQHLTSATA